MPVISRDSLSPSTPEGWPVNSHRLLAASARVREQGSAACQRASQACRDNQEAMARSRELRAEAEHLCRVSRAAKPRPY